MIKYIVGYLGAGLTFALTYAIDADYMVTVKQTVANTGGSFAGQGVTLMVSASGKDAAAIAGLSANEKRHTMHGAPLWARSATVAAGPIFNFILALVVYWGLILWTGVATERPVIGTVATLPGAAQPLASGDQVLTLNGVETPDLESYLLAARDLPAAASVDYRILRDGTEQMVTAAHPMPPLVASVQLKSAAIAAGLEEGDVILAANGQPVTAFAELPPIVEGLAGAPVPLTVWRADGSETGKVFDITGSYHAAFINGVMWNALNLSIALWLLWRVKRAATVSA